MKKPAVLQSLLDDLAYRRSLRHALRQLQDGRLRDKLKEALHKRLTASDKALFARIEARRAALLRSSERVIDVDYGAGQPTQLATPEMMQTGVAEEIAIKDAASWSKDRIWAELLFFLARSVNSKKCLELGTCVGISGSYIATALKTTGAHLWTVEGSAGTFPIAKQTLVTVGLDEHVTAMNMRFSDAIAQLTSEGHKLDFAFIDGHHDGDATVAYFEQITPLLNDNAIVFFDDIEWSPSMRAAWTTIMRDRSLVGCTNVAGMGIGDYSA